MAQQHAQQHAQQQHAQPPACANEGNSCFLNASYQLLRRWGRTDDDVREWRARKLPRAWRDGRQHDAHEVLLAMLAQLPAPEESGELQSVIRCGATDEASRVSESFDILSLPVAPSLQLAVERFCHESEELRGANVWRSPQAQRLRVTPVRSWKSMDITRWPRRGVVFHFKRFGNSGDKIADDIALPATWHDMQLVGVVRHHGTYRSGHYTALIHTNQWYLCDDSTIVPSGLSARDAYLALYVPAGGAKNVRT